MNDIFARIWENLNAPIDGPMNGCNDSRDSCWAAGCTSGSAGLPLSSSVESGSSPRIVVTGMERCRKCPPSRHDSGRVLPTHRSPRRLHPGIADYGSNLGNRSSCSGSRPDRSHRENGIRRQTFCETTPDPISSVTLCLVTDWTFLHSGDQFPRAGSPARDHPNRLRERNIYRMHSCRGENTDRASQRCGHRGNEHSKLVTPHVLRR